MNRTLKTLLGFLAVSVAILAALLMTGCNTLQKAQDEYPIAYDLLKGGAEIALTSYLATTDDSFAAENRTLLLGATRAVFAEYEDPVEVGIALSEKIEGFYPDDPATRDAILRNLANVLRSESSTPASRPKQARYNAELADELIPGVDPKWNEGLRYMLENPR